MRLTVILIFVSFFSLAQEIHEKIKIKKSDYSIYFFNTSSPSEVINSTNNLFVLQLGSSRKCKTVIEITNGQLKPIKNDSIYKLVHLPGMNYRHLFISSTEQNNSSSTASQKLCPDFKTEVNGANTLLPDSVIQIKLLNLSNDSIHLTNKYYYR